MTTLHYPLKLILAFTLLLLHACNSEDLGSQPENEIYMWSHNDYEQSQPLLDAVGLGFQMIESDVHLIDGKLYVTHDHPKNPDQTSLLEGQYLEPLSEIIEQNNGVVITESSVAFYLVIDVKTEAEPTFEAISKVIEPYRELFTRKENGTWIEGPLNLLISGNRPAVWRTLLAAGVDVINVDDLKGFKDFLDEEGFIQ